MTSSQFSTVQIAAILDCLCEAVDAARASAAAAPSWLRAIDAAYDYLLTADAIEYSHADHALRVPSASEPGRYYTANGDCQCKAHTTGGGICWHRAAARLVRRAVERLCIVRTAQQFSAQDASYNRQGAAAVNDQRSAAFWSEVIKEQQAIEAQGYEAAHLAALAIEDAEAAERQLEAAAVEGQAVELASFAAAWDAMVLRQKISHVRALRWAETEKMMDELYA
jgi:hypothetical protein